MAIVSRVSEAIQEIIRKDRRAQEWGFVPVCIVTLDKALTEEVDNWLHGNSRGGYKIFPDKVLFEFEHDATVFVLLGF